MGQHQNTYANPEEQTNALSVRGVHAQAFRNECHGGSPLERGHSDKVLAKSTFANVIGMVLEKKWIVASFIPTPELKSLTSCSRITKSCCRCKTFVCKQQLEKWRSSSLLFPMLR
eukprot:3737527-Amphidinium_carterae.1